MFDIDTIVSDPRLESHYINIETFNRRSNPQHLRFYKETAALKPEKYWILKALSFPKTVSSDVAVSKCCIRTDF